MRRKDREMGRNFAFAVIDKSIYGVLSVLNADNTPYAIPLSLVRKGDNLYFHSAKGGTKVDLFAGQPTVCIAFVGETKIPELFSEEELESFLENGDKGSALGSKVFTTEYESALVFGDVVLIEDTNEAVEALALLCEKYTPSKMPYFDMAVKTSLLRTNIYRVNIRQVTAKRKKFDTSGEEMKWGRMK